ncbi:MAG: adenosylcobalamin-dependent ribonucleoside-diphosphate reductase, partial [Deltaproteobacteria bacterium]|nr:adenosylcobalamin-dependent ribonucleoside-diphosphate reductase [Deltaproteobacteria bacterium]
MKTVNHKNSFSQMRMAILKKRYLRKDKLGKVVETETQMYRRVADTIVSIESIHGATKAQIKIWASKFYRMMKNEEFLPNSPTLMNANRKNGMLSACFVLSIEDSIKGIFDTVKNTALIQKAGGGTGFSFDKLRPTGDLVTSSGGTTSGPISFWKVLSETTHAIQQGAFRRGANMGMMSVNHPDIIKFIFAKMNLDVFTNFNISIKVPDDFMKQLQETPNTLHVVINPRTGKRYVIPHSIDIHSYTINDLIPQSQADDCFTVSEIWNIIIVNAHATGEPGICFIDHINKFNPTPHIGLLEATNPCGEQPLLSYEACNLGSLNITKFVNEKRTDLNWNLLAKTVRLAVRFLDNVIDANYFPIPEIRKVTFGNRKIGLGIMGFADTLILLGIRYDSKEAMQFAEKLSSFIQKHAHQASEDLAKERGCFTNWKGSIWDTKYNKPMRNAAVTTIAPTGSISIIAGCSSGMEPVFSFVYERRTLDGNEFIQIHPLLEKLGTEQGWLTDKVRDLLVQGTLPKEISEIPKQLAEVLVTAHEVTPEEHVRIQAVFQKYTDNAVSKTVNLPSNATVEDVDKIFRLAYQLNCKGITVYRDGCRDNQVITNVRKTSQSEISIPFPRPRPKKTIGTTIKSKTGCGSLFITLNR